MKTKIVLSNSYESLRNEVLGMIHSFDEMGQAFGAFQDRNKMRVFEHNDHLLNIKSFKVPHLINRIVYRFFRKGKAQRSYEYAQILLSKGIGTPEPIAYYEELGWFTFNRSYYVSKQQDSDLTYRELTFDLNYPDFENILRQFTRFTFQLHENGINFLDHSPGNTLIKKNINDYEFYLVDLNRMKFGSMSFDERIKNFAKLTVHKVMVEIMSDEYAKCINASYDEVFDLMWGATNDFQAKWRRKQAFKKRIKFWKKKA